MFIAAAVAFLCGAIDLALARVASPALAALGAAGGALVIAAAVALAARFLARRRAGAAALQADRIAAELGALLGKEATSFAAAHPKGTVLASLLAGFAVGADPALRRALRDLLR